jgi:3-oxoacyl-[acyl-carrier protein] reductase
MDLRIKGKRALVCASSQGIGRAIARGLAAEGVQLFLCARDKDKLSGVADEMEKEFGARPMFQAADLSSEQSRNELINNVKSAFGSVDIIVHNTGGPKPTSAEVTTAQEWLDGYTRLFTSVQHLTGAFLPEMKKQRWGRIVAVTSLSVLEPIPGLAISNAMRSAVTAMLKTLSDEVASHNICINCVAPGLIHTDRTEERLSGAMEKTGKSRDEHLDDYVKAVPAGRLGTPDEFAHVACFLCSDLASYVTGSTICVDGGKRRSTY